MKFKPLPPFAELCADLDYCPATGDLVWKNNPNRRRRADVVGKRVGCVGNGGYVMFNYRGTVLYAHRVAFAMYHKCSVEDIEIDHIDGNRQNNRAVNLRAARREQNAANSRKHSDNASGIKGVYYCNTRKVWFGSVMRKGKLRRTHGCPTKESAERVLRELRQSLHREFTNHG